MFRFIILLLLFMSTLYANIAKISAITGDATVNRNNAVIVATLGMILQEKDIVQTKPNATLQIIFEDKTIITIGKNSSLDIAEYLYDMQNPENSKAQFNFFKGAFKTVTGTIGKLNKKKFKLKTKSATIGIRGTVIIGNQEVVACTQGGITVSSNGVSVNVDANHLTRTNEGEAPTEAEPISNELMDNLQVSFSPNEETTQDTQENNDTNATDEQKSSEESSNSSENTNSETTSQNEEVSETSTTSSEVTTQVETPVVETTEVAESSTTSDVALKGRVLGFTSSTNMPLDTLSATKTGKKLTLNASGINDEIDSDTFSLSGTQTFDKTYSSSYSTFDRSKLGIINLSNSNYDVYTDSKGEVFLLTRDNGASSKEMIVVGKSGSSDSLSDSKVYRYDIFNQLQIQRDTSNEVNTRSGTDTKFTMQTDAASAGHIYYNAASDSWTYLDPDFYKNGASTFVAGYNNTLVSYENKYEYDSSTVINYFTSASSANLSFLGSEAQSVLINIDSKKVNQSASPNTSNDYDTLVSAFQNTAAISSANSSGILTLRGLTSTLLVTKSTKKATILSDSNQAANIKVDRALTTISGNLGSSSGSEFAGLAYDAKGSDKTAYYITDDLFGSLGQAGATKSSYKLSTDNGSTTLSQVNESAMIAVPDGAYVDGTFKMFDSNDNPLMSDDASSWGYWTADYGDSRLVHVDPLSTWVAGIDNATSTIDALIKGSSTSAVFNGKVMGYVAKLDSNNIITSLQGIDMGDTNKVKLTFDFGSGAINNINTANDASFMKFQSIDGNSTWDLRLFETSTSNSGFSGKLSKSETVGTSIGTFNGKFFGDGQLQSVGGNFTATTGGETAAGVFKATKQ